MRSNNDCRKGNYNSNIRKDDGVKGVIINTDPLLLLTVRLSARLYGASKADVVGMTVQLAREFADCGIWVVTIVPGLSATPMLLFYRSGFTLETKQER